VLEILVVNDGSTDGTAAMLREMEAAGLVRAITQANAGAGASRNTAIRSARGTFVAFLDADDLWRPDKLAVQMPLLADPDVGLVYSNVAYLGESAFADFFAMIGVRHRGQVFDRLVHDNFIPTSSVVVRRSVIGGRGFCEDRTIPIGEDYWFWLHLARVTRFDYTERCLVDYRIHADQASASARKSNLSLARLYAALAREAEFADCRLLLRRKSWENRIKYWVRGLAISRGVPSTAASGGG
jgi:glycosyltransferase involved in cell wall biosynthesis